MTMRQQIKQADDRLEEAMLSLLLLKHLSYNAAYNIAVTRNEIRAARRLLAAALDGPKVTRQKRVAAEVSMTGLEEELPL